MIFIYVYNCSLCTIIVKKIIAPMTMRNVSFDLLLSRKGCKNNKEFEILTFMVQKLKINVYDRLDTQDLIFRYWTPRSKAMAHG